MCVDVAVRSLLTIACCFEIDAVAVGTQADTVKCLRLQLPFLNLRTRTYTHTYMKALGSYWQALNCLDLVSNNLRNMVLFPVLVICMYMYYTSALCFFSPDP